MREQMKNKAQFETWGYRGAKAKRREKVLEIRDG